MLVQSHGGEISFLPALPPAWPEGHFSGLRARGNVEVDASWADGKAVSGTLRPGVSGEVRIRPPRGQRIRRIQSGDRPITATESGGVWVVRLETGRVYHVTFE
jgi:alpha-L-fucosidase 2